MNEQQKAMLDQQLKLRRGAAIIEGSQEKFRQDGYSNLLTKYGTKQDNSTAYQYNQELIADDMELIRLYEGNGLFTKIIDRPSEEAVKHGFDIDFGDECVTEYVDYRMDGLDFEAKFATAEKWARLYGGSIIVMLVDDGNGLEEPIDWENVRTIEELRVFERAIVQPDYTSMYHFHFLDTIDSNRPFAEPEYYQVFSIYGYFIVHRSRCLVFRNGRLPEQTTNAIYRYWGIPEYVKIKGALRECVTSHENGTKLLERCVQAIYKMKNLANLLSTEDGEDKVLQRLQVIDMARNILNSIAIDSDGEDYDFKTFTMSGVKDVLDSTCNMLSAVTEIPQTILFGRSPAGMNSTGKNDMENYYNMVENIQKQNMKKNSRTVIDLILRQGKLEGMIPSEPKYKVKFAKLWSMDESEQASVDKTKADTGLVKAQTAAAYMENSVLDPSEVRKSLASEGEFEIEEILSDEGLNIPEDTFDIGEKATVGEPIEILGQTNDEDEGEVIEIDMPGNHLGSNEKVVIAGTEGEPESEGDTETITIEGVPGNGREANYPAAAAIIIKDGKILCASRRNNEGLCGPGGHVEDGEEPFDAASRETMEEFNIVPLNLLPLGEYKGSSGRYLPSMVYWTDKFSGTPEADGHEMLDERWMSLGELKGQHLYPPFEASLDMLENHMRKYLTRSHSTDTITIENIDGGPGSGDWGHAGRPGKIGGSGGGGGVKNRKGSKESGFTSEAKERKSKGKPESAQSNAGKVDSSKVKVEGYGLDNFSKGQKDTALTLAGGRSIGVEGSEAVIKGEPGHYNARVIGKDAEVKVMVYEDRNEVYLDSIFVKKPGNGKGTEVVADVVDAAKEEGFSKVTAFGAGIKGDAYNGYYTLPRLGFDGKLSPMMIDKAKKDGFQVTKVSELMATSSGRSWWKENGAGIDLEFDLLDGSYSLKTLEEYTGLKIKSL